MHVRRQYPYLQACHGQACPESRTTPTLTAGMCLTNRVQQPANETTRLQAHQGLPRR